MKEKKERKKKGRKEDRKVKKKLVLEKQEMGLLLFLIYEHAVLRPQELVCRRVWRCRPEKHSNARNRA